MAYGLRELPAVNARGAAGGAKGLYGLRELPPENKSNVFAQAGSGAAEGVARTATLPVDIPGMVGGLADWIGGEGTSKYIGAGLDAATAMPMALGSMAYNNAAQGAAGLLGLSPEVKANMPTMKPTLSANYDAVRNVAGGDAAVGLLKDAGIVSKVDPENAAQRYSRAVGNFLGGAAIPVGATLNAARNAARAGTAGSFLAPIAANPGKFLGANALAATSGAVTGEAAYDATGSQTARFAGGLLGGFIPGAAAAGVRRAFTGGATGRDSIRRAMDDYAAIGSKPTLGQALADAKSPIGTAIDRGLSILQPGFYSRRLADQAANAEGFVQSTLAKVSKGAPSDIGAGLAAKAGAEGFVDRFRQVSKKAYDRVDRFIKPDAPADLTNTKTALNDIAARFSATPAIADTIQSPTIRRFMSAIEKDAAASTSGTIPYKSLKAMRTEVFAAKNADSGLLQDINKADLNKLYSALSDDMAATAKAQGGSRAVKALETANKLYAQGAKRIEDVIEPLTKGETPEGVFRAIQRGDASRVAAFMSSIAPEQRATISARVLERLGEAAPSQGIPGQSGFSFETFLSNYNKLKGSRALEVLFNKNNAPSLGGKGTAALKQSLDRLSAIAARARFIDRQLYNPSGTANRLLEGASMAGMAGGAVFSPATAGLLLTAKLASNIGAKALNSEAFMNWLAKGPLISAQKWPGHLARLQTIAQQNPELAPEVRKIQQQLVEGKDGIDKLATVLSIIPGMGGVVAATNDARNYASGKRELSAENIALTGMNLLPEGGALLGKAEDAAPLIRMDDPLRSGVAVAAGDPQAFLASLKINSPTNPALGAAGAISEPAARAAGVEYGPEAQQPPQQPQEQSQRQTSLKDLILKDSQPQQKPQDGADLLGGRIASGLDWLLMGAGDELLAGASTVAKADPKELRQMLGLEEGSSPTYNRELATARGLRDQYQKERPGEALAVGLPAAIGGSIATGIGSLAAKGAGIVGKSALGAVEGAGRGALTGFLSGEGGAEGRTKTAGDSAVLGAAAGGALGAALPAVQSGVKWLREQRDFYNFLTGTLTADGKKLAKSLGIDPRGMEKELNTVTKEAVRVANEVMKDPEGARKLLQNAVAGLKKGGVNGNLDTNLVVQTIRNVMSDQHAVYDPAWRRVFGEALNPEKPLYKALQKLAEGQVGDKAKTWEKILPMVVREAEKRLGPLGPTSRFWDPAKFKPAPIVPQTQEIDRAMKGIKARPRNDIGSFGPPQMYSNPLDPEAINRLLVQPLRGLLSGKGAAKAAPKAPEGITAYHGSPHTFDKFDMSKIGTGENTQAYGRGLYFTGSEDVAKMYKEDLAKLANKQGSVYQVRLNVKPGELIDLDQPLSQQPKVLQDIARGADLSHLKDGGRVKTRLEWWRSNAEQDRAFPATAGLFYDAISNFGKSDTSELSAKLMASGIKGFRYLDRSGVGKSQNAYNYVIFDDKLIDILKRYGIPITVGAGGSAMVLGSDMPEELKAQMGGA